MNLNSDVERNAVTIAEAIAARRRLALRYGGASRVYEPHTLGVDASGAMLVCGYQVRGGSASGQASGWKTLPIAGISALETLEESFHHPRPEYRHDDPGFSRILAQL